MSGQVRAWDSQGVTKIATDQGGPGQEPSEAFDTPVNPVPNKQSKEDVFEQAGEVWVPLGIRFLFAKLC